MFEENRDELIQADLSQPLEEKRTYTVNEIQDILGISLSGAYKLIGQKCFKVVRVGRSIRISKKSFDNWLDNL